MFEDRESSKVYPDVRNLSAFADYRRLGRRLLDGRDLRDLFGIQAVALAPNGLFVFVERKLTAVESDHLRRAAGFDGFIRDIGQIVPVTGGGEAIRATKASGTFGCLAQDASTTVGLTCDHVVGASAGHSPGDPVHCGQTRIGSFLRGSTISLSTAAANRVDAALIELDAPSSHPSTIRGISGAPSGVNRALMLGDNVRKSGATTSVTSGRFQYIVTMNVPYAGGLARFVDQIGIDGGGIPFADKGDSGAVVLDDAGKVAGLLFAAAPQSALGFANWIDDIEVELGVSI